MKSRVVRGKGTLADFQEAYNVMQDSEEFDIVASVQYPNGSTHMNSQDTDMIFEWLIFYKEFKIKPKEGEKEEMKLVM